MMTGQILGGVPSSEAVKYQIQQPPLQMVHNHPRLITSCGASDPMDIFDAEGDVRLTRRDLLSVTAGVLAGGSGSTTVRRTRHDQAARGCAASIPTAPLPASLCSARCLLDRHAGQTRPQRADALSPRPVRLPDRSGNAVLQRANSQRQPCRPCPIPWRLGAGNGLGRWHSVRGEVPRSQSRRHPPEERQHHADLPEAAARGNRGAGGRAPNTTTARWMLLISSK